nr:hypothetical protein Iba_chr03bCG4120 [Ipomoea batatas]
MPHNDLQLIDQIFPEKDSLFFPNSTFNLSVTHPTCPELVDGHHIQKVWFAAQGVAMVGALAMSNIFEPFSHASWNGFTSVAKNACPKDPGPLRDMNMFMQSTHLSRLLWKLNPQCILSQGIQWEVGYPVEIPDKGKSTSTC